MSRGSGKPDIDWTNDDLLMSDAARESLALEDKAVAELLDWPALRVVFGEHECAANRNKRHARRSGLQAMCSLFGALVLTAFAELCSGPDIWQRALSSGLGGLAAVSALLCIGSGLLQMYHGPTKRAWMVERLFTEVLRRFYFQFVLQNLTLAHDVVNDTRLLAEWRQAQERALLLFVQEIGTTPKTCLDQILDDGAEEKVWVLSEWKALPACPVTEPDAAYCRLFRILDRKRIAVQVDYTYRKLDATDLSLRGQSKILRNCFYALVFTVLLLHAANGVLRVIDIASPVITGITTTGFLATIASAIIVSLQMWDRGNRVSTETERLECYLARIKRAESSYSKARTVAAIVEIFQTVEEAAYSEMRRFFVEVKHSEFVAG